MKTRTGNLTASKTRLNRIAARHRGSRTCSIRSVSLSACCLFWLLLSGFFTPFLVAAGVGSALAVVWFARRMDVVDDEGHPIRLGPKALVYWPWLLKEIVKSAWERQQDHRRIPSCRSVRRWCVSSRRRRTDVGLVIHANSITLTPGTITIEANPTSSSSTA